MLTYDGGAVLSARNAAGLLRCLLARRPSLPTNHRTPLHLLPKVLASCICRLYIASYVSSVLILAMCVSSRFHIAYAVAVCVCVRVCVRVCVCACVRQ